MAHIDLSLQDILHAERHRLKIQDAHDKSLERKGGMNLEMEQVAAQVDESIFEDDEINHEDCEIQECFECYEEAIGRAEAAAEGMER